MMHTPQNRLPDGNSTVFALGTPEEQRHPFPLLQSPVIGGVANHVSTPKHVACPMHLKIPT